jgi:2-polyprenyl-6-methoxyphenol hydroxylase-like FAD-dependent oxidoreductase
VVRVTPRNWRDPEGSTYGWGVTYRRGLLDRLHEQDPESAALLDAGSVRWNDGVARVRDLTTRHSGDQGHGIGRHRLLEILAARARDLGVRLEYERAVTAGYLPSGADLIVAADGVRSERRACHSAHFGTTKVFDAFTFACTASPAAPS